MSRGRPIPKDELERLYYTEHRSMQQIATHFGCSLNKVVYWMQQYGFERRDWSEATYVHRNPFGNPFTIRPPETPDEWKLFGVGIGLYMGEGSKKAQSVALANSNPAILRTFIAFLERFCGIDRNRLLAELNIYDDCDVQTTIEWWCEQLEIQASQFGKPHIKKSRGGTYLNKSSHGTLTIRFCNTKLRKIILEWCEEFQ